MTKLIDLAGRKFARLTVIERAGSARGTTTAAWRCRCDCGTEKVISSRYLRTGHTRSCGCLVAEKAAANGRASRDKTSANRARHGHARVGKLSLTFRSWRAMLQRCTDPNHGSYADYGGRGISVCERWLKFENFLEDMGERPPGTSLDRHPNNRGNYEPGNARWATDATQQTNRTNNRRLTLRGTTRTITEWARVLGMPLSTLVRRAKRGLSDEQVLAPTKRHPNDALDALPTGEPT